MSTVSSLLTRDSKCVIQGTVKTLIFCMSVTVWSTIDNRWDRPGVVDLAESVEVGVRLELPLEGYLRRIGLNFAFYRYGLVQ